MAKSGDRDIKNGKGGGKMATKVVQFYFEPSKYAQQTSKQKSVFVYCIAIQELASVFENGTYDDMISYIIYLRSIYILHVEYIFIKKLGTCNHCNDDVSSNSAMVLFFCW